MRTLRESGGGTTASKQFSVIDLKPVSPISFTGNIASILPPPICLLNFISQLILNLEIMVSYLLASLASINRIEKPDKCGSYDLIQFKIEQQKIKDRVGARSTPSTTAHPSRSTKKGWASVQRIQQGRKLVCHKIPGQCEHKALNQHSLTSVIQVAHVSTSWDLKGVCVQDGIKRLDSLDTQIHLWTIMHIYHRYANNVWVYFLNDLRTHHF